jgi:prevent-host-death family protein
MSDHAGLRELRQNASDLVRRAEQGEVITVTVSGRAAAQLGPVPPRGLWRRGADLAELFAGPVDPTWATDRELVDEDVVDPFAR